MNNQEEETKQEVSAFQDAQNLQPQDDKSNKKQAPEVPTPDNLVCAQGVFDHSETTVPSLHLSDSQVTEQAAPEQDQTITNNIGQGHIGQIPFFDPPEIHKLENDDEEPTWLNTSQTWLAFGHGKELEKRIDSLEIKDLKKEIHRLSVEKWQAD